MFLYDKSEVHRNYGIVVAEESEALYVIYWVTRWHPLQTHNFTMRMLQDRGVQSRMSHMQIDWTDQIVSSRSPSALFTRINRQLWQYKPNGAVCTMGLRKLASAGHYIGLCRIRRITLDTCNEDWCEEGVQIHHLLSTSAVTTNYWMYDGFSVIGGDVSRRRA